MNEFIFAATSHMANYSMLPADVKAKIARKAATDLDVLALRSVDRQSRAEPPANLAALQRLSKLMALATVMYRKLEDTGDDLPCIRVDTPDRQYELGPDTWNGFWLSDSNDEDQSATPDEVLSHFRHLTGRVQKMQFLMNLDAQPALTYTGPRFDLDLANLIV